MATDDVTDEDEIGFRPTFSRECEAIFNAARMGAFLTLEELRNNLRLAGMWLGPDQIEAPDFEFPDPPDEEDVDTDMEGDE